MATPNNEPCNWFAVFRTDENCGWLYTELTEGRLRQGWGVPGLGLRTAGGGEVSKAEWADAYRAHTDWGNPSRMRFAILSRMIEMHEGDIVVVPKMPQWNQFTVARVSGEYLFEPDGDHGDFGHIVPVDPVSVRTFDYRANNDAFLVSGQAVRQAFRDQGYQVQEDHRRYDGEGGDVDIVVLPPAGHGLFLPAEIAVQVKWKQGIDENDKEAVRQIGDWTKSEGSEAAKYVISSASGFTGRAREEAAADGVVLIGGNKGAKITKR